MNIKWYAAGLVLGISFTAQAANQLAAVDVSHCRQMVNTPSPFILVLKKGQAVVESITRCAIDAKITGAALNGIGTIERPTLAFYNFKMKRNLYKNFDGYYELLSLTGNLSLLDDKPEARLAAVISDEQTNVFGGRLNEAFVSGTVEVLITPLTKTLIRKADPKTGLELIDTH